MTDYIQVFVTFEHKEEARKISRQMVEKRLAACAQIIGPIISTYHWKENIEEAEEWLCVFKSKRDLYDELEKSIKEVHPYEVPEIIGVPISVGSKSYLEWLEKETLKS